MSQKKYYQCDNCGVIIEEEEVVFKNWKCGCGLTDFTPLFNNLNHEYRKNNKGRSD